MWRGYQFVVLLVFSIGFMGCHQSSGEAGTSGTDQRPMVRVAEVRQTQEPDWQRFPGVLRAENRAKSAFLHSGRLASRPVAEGDRVSQGEVLAVLHNPALAPAAAAARARVEEITAEIHQLTRDLERSRALRARDLIPEERVDQLESRLRGVRESRDQAEAALAEAEAQEAELQLRAPFDGQVVAALAEPGDFVAAGQTIVRLIGMENLEVEIALPASFLDELDRDGPVHLSRPLQGGTFAARLLRIGQGERAMRTAVVGTEAVEGLATGQVVQVHLSRHPHGQLELPLEAVVDPGGQAPYVWRLMESDDGPTVERVHISPGRLQNNWVSVGNPRSDINKLAAGDHVVVAGQSRLSDGNTVRIWR